MRLARGSLGGAVTHAGFVGGDRGVGEELDVCLTDAPQVGVDDDGAVHLAELAQACGREGDVEVEAARAHGLHFGRVAEDDQCARVGALDSFQTLA